MSMPPSARASQATGLAPPPANVLQPMRGSSIFAPPPPMSAVPSRPQSRLEPPPLSATAGPMPGTAQRPIHGPRKRLIVTCDGTWRNSDNGLKNGVKQQPSNVSRIGWAVKDTSRDGIPQIVHYQAGVGTMGGQISRLIGGATGEGLKQNVREAYTYLAVNYRDGDEIFLMGFSRGAFTARSVGGLIGDMGLLTRAGMPSFNEIFEDAEHRHDDRYISKFPEVPFPGKGAFNNRYVAELERQGLTRLRIPIKAICCWDTVGSLGIPRIGFLGALGLESRGMHQYQFYDTKINPCVENAFQALALDEKRAPFSPALWEKKDNETTNLKQVWFAGAHTNIGGGYDDQELSNITLAWMISRLEPFLDFRPDYLISCFQENRDYYKQTGQRTRWWSFGLLVNSFKGFHTVLGSKTRMPGDFYRADPITGSPTSKRLKNTNEYIHASVRSRMGLRGPGVQDRGDYDPLGLRDWTFAPETAGGGQGGNADGMMVIWTNHSHNGGQEKIPEAVLLETELTLLRNSPRVGDYIRSLREPVKEKRRSRRIDDDPAMANGAAAPRRHHRRDGSGNPNPPPYADPAMGGPPDQAPPRDPDRARKRRSRRYDD